MNKMPIFNHIVLTGIVPPFAWDDYCYIGNLVPIVRTGKFYCLRGVPIFTLRCPYLHKYRHREGIEMPIFT